MCVCATKTEPEPVLAPANQNKQSIFLQQASKVFADRKKDTQLFDFDFDFGFGFGFVVKPKLVKLNTTTNTSAGTGTCTAALI